MLDHLFSGYNCTLFAYGQTASGKSYTVMELGVNKGNLIKANFRNMKTTYLYVTHLSFSNIPFRKIII